MMRKLKFKTKLILTFLVLITIPIGILGFGSYYTSQDVVLDLAQQNMLEIVKKNNELIDERLSRIQDSSLGLSVDCGLFRLFNQANPHDSFSFIHMNEQITDILKHYYANAPDIISVQLGTSYFVFGDKTRNIIPSDRFVESDLFHSVTARGGRETWIPTYDYTEMYQLKELENSNITYRYLLTSAKSMNLSCVSNSTISHLSSQVEPPILMINFSDSLFQRVFSKSVPIEGSSYFIVSPQGNIISHQDWDRSSSSFEYPLLGDLFAKKSGTEIIEYEGRKWIASFATSSITGWLSLVMIPHEALLQDILSTIRSYMLYLSIGLSILSAFLAFIFSARITNPIFKIIGAIKKVGGGNFDTRIEAGDSYEFGILINKFNDMNDKIKKLIEENYVVKLREKESEIMALNIQLNPHFLYNTLNIMNWMAINGEKEKTSKMLVSLSRMLQYTTHNHEETTLLEEDLNWLKDYVYILTNRFGDAFAIEYVINPYLMKCKVPKLFLQPFLENAIMHGFSKMEHGGIVNIYGWQQEDRVYFSVEDNGCGFDVHELSRQSDAGYHVGIQNVDKRIKLLYGDAFGVQIESKLGKGTNVLIILPFILEG